MKDSLSFEAVAEDRPGRKWRRRWDWSWPAYEAWFAARGGDAGPSRVECETAIRRYMPELAALHASHAALAGDGDRAARFLSGWCPPPYLGGCSIAAHAQDGEVRLVRNYDLSPDLNEGLLLKSAWRRPVMGMVEFLWGLSDGINDAGLCIALAFGGRSTVAPGFGITHIVRYLLETCATVDEAEATLARLPSHMAYNLVLADASGRVASVELFPGGGLRRVEPAIATNHQHGPEPADRASFTRTVERRSHMSRLISNGTPPSDLAAHLLRTPLYQDRHSKGFGTLFTASYDPLHGRMSLLWPGEAWVQSFAEFTEGTRSIVYRPDFRATPEQREPRGFDATDWTAFGLAVARRYAVAYAHHGGVACMSWCEGTT